MTRTLVLGQMVRMKAAADQLLTLSTAANQWPRRDFALFHVLYATAMRVSELIGLDIDQYDGRYLTNMQTTKDRHAEDIPRQGRPEVPRPLHRRGTRR